MAAGQSAPLSYIRVNAGFSIAGAKYYKENWHQKTIRDLAKADLEAANFTEAGN
jgi:hypothetical protein